MSLLLCLLLSFHALVIARSVYGQSECPSPEVMHPCTCKNVAYGLHVVCANVDSTTLLHQTLKRIDQHQLDNLLFHALDFKTPVPEDIFVGMRINVLQVESSRIMFKGLAFHGLEETLKQLNIMQCSTINDGDSFNIAPLNKLHEFHFRNNKLDSVNSHWLKDKMPNVQIINLDHNDIGLIEENSFATLKHLRQISLSENSFTSVSRNMFPQPALSLTKIDLSHNKLQVLPTDIFSEMPSLSSVVLSGNNLQSIPKATWEDIWNHVNSVYLVENSIICDNRIEWIKEQRLPKKLEGTCAEPKEKMGRPLKDILK